MLVRIPTWPTRYSNPQPIVLILALSTLGVCIISALFPLVNAEAYIGAIAVAHPDQQTWWLALVAALGQTVGKTLFYFLGTNSLRWNWVRRKVESPRGRARLERWQRRTSANTWAGYRPDWYVSTHWPSASGDHQRACRLA